ncbi:hypothetical protein HYALB_00004160 [Hymenoscyphus albidus]|uniref:4-hydroxy-3-methoxy-5-polyprenylbenzoate decarboxylase n=1 Tax=Hymenoscyphus albidus TaxID=595503 RepID=A0A9N9LFV8_9HELO|nr:hypothetical protein HYALB_00004160 [Hymenoscyphus albidus]
MSLLRSRILNSNLPRELIATCTLTPPHREPHHRQFSVLNRPPPNYEGHVPLTKTERVGMAIGSAVLAFLNPRRAETNKDLIATLGETTSQPYFITRLRDTMLLTPSGRRILRLRPRITSSTLSLPHLRSLPKNTLGHTYALWLDREGVSPDTRDAVKYIDDEECAYVMQRYRECHDFYHAITGLPVWREGEVALKGFEAVNLGLPMAGLSVAAVATLKKGERSRFWGVYGPWAVENGVGARCLIDVFWEELLERDVGEVRRELGIEMPVDLRGVRKAERERRRKGREEGERSGDGLGIN